MRPQVGQTVVVCGRPGQGHRVALGDGLVGSGINGRRGVSRNVGDGQGQRVRGGVGAVADRQGEGYGGVGGDVGGLKGGGGRARIIKCDG